jgi:hypothetical protein
VDALSLYDSTLGDGGEKKDSSNKTGADAKKNAAAETARKLKFNKTLWGEGTEYRSPWNHWVGADYLRRHSKYEVRI